jgi:Flp pilus assembly protein TadG
MPRLTNLLPRWTADLVRRLVSDRAGNTLLIIAASVVPMLALVGGGIDMGRSYLSQARLQQACDAGVLAARKKLGATVVTDGVLPSDAATIGNRFFDLNFNSGAYGTTDRSYAMTLGNDYSVNGVATATVPTTIMKIFGFASVPVNVKCSAQFNYANTDIMMVLDTTGSMNDKAVSTDPKSKIDTLRQVVKDFYTSVESKKTQGVRIRYGFVPYSTNVNVGFLLKSSWMADSTNVESRSAVYTGTGYSAAWRWRYQSTPVDVSSFKGSTDNALYVGGSKTFRTGNVPSNPTNETSTFKGCIEERATYIINDYNNVDLSRARDLDIDAVPVKTDPDTQWRPMLHEQSWLRAVTSSGGYWSPATVDSTTNYMRASDYGFTACPGRARKLAEMTSSDVSSYIDSLVAEGSTYHDIGMIWGGRLISPTGIFASENGDVNGRPTMRHLIFLTDGLTQPLDYSYGSYGVERLSQRRWSSSSPYTLTQTVEKRFTYACNAVKNKNITVWVIGFGTTVTDLMKNCAGANHWFQANNATQLSAAFAAIASAIGDLRVIK